MTNANTKQKDKDKDKNKDKDKDQDKDKDKDKDKERHDTTRHDKDEKRQGSRAFFGLYLGRPHAGETFQTKA